MYQIDDPTYRKVKALIVRYEQLNDIKCYAIPKARGVTQHSMWFQALIARLDEEICQVRLDLASILKESTTK